MVAQIIATFLVIFGHSYPFETSFPRWLYDLRTFIYAFHMPLFIWISGYLLIYTNQVEGNHIRFIKKRFLRLLVPYVVLSLIAIVPKHLLASLLNRGFDFNFHSFIEAFLVPRQNVWGHFWFLPMIFLMGVFGFAVDRLFFLLQSKRTRNNAPSLSIRKWGWFIVSLILFSLYLWSEDVPLSGWFSISDIVRFGWVFAFGCFCASLNVNLSFKRSANLILFFSCLAGALFLFLFPFFPLGGYLKFALIAVLMIFCILALSNLLALHFVPDRFSLLSNTFAIFLLSWPCQAVSNVFTERIFHAPYVWIMSSQLFWGVVGPILLLALFRFLEVKFHLNWFSRALGSNLQNK